MMSRGQTLITLCVCAFLLQSFKPILPSQQPSQALKPGYYVVVAAYRQGQDDYAERYMNKINADGNHALYGLDIGRKFLYVYLDYYTDYNESIRQMLRVRSEGVFTDAWVRVMREGLDTEVNMLTEANAKPENAAEQTTPEAEEATAAREEEVQPITKNDKPVDASFSSETVEIEVTDSMEIEVSASPAPVPVTTSHSLSNTQVFLSLYNAQNHNVVDGEVEVIDVDRARLISAVKGNDYITLPDPESRSGELKLACKVFGYRPMEHRINYKETEADTVKDYIDRVGNYYMVRFDLVRIHKGDISTLFNVYFYKDAGIMLPESKYQLKQLLDMMEENSHYRIMLHGHTNGNARGKIITMGSSQNFFALTDDVKEGFGSAKALSGERAEVIKEWLVSRGINPHRIETKAWGGKRMLYDQNSANAAKNVRVDVEIIEE